MTQQNQLKVHTPIPKWRNIHDHVNQGDIIYVTLPIEKETIRFRLIKNKLRVELEEESRLDKESIERDCLMLLGRDDWSSQFVGYAYPSEGSLTLYAIYDLNFQVYLDGITVQKIAEVFGFVPHPILYHGAVKTGDNETVSEFLLRTIGESKMNAFRKRQVNEQVVVENVSRTYEYRRIIGSWGYINKEQISGYSEDKKYLLSI